MNLFLIFPTLNCFFALADAAAVANRTSGISLDMDNSDTIITPSMADLTSVEKGENIWATSSITDLASNLKSLANRIGAASESQERPTENNLTPNMEKELKEIFNFYSNYELLYTLEQEHDSLTEPFEEALSTSFGLLDTYAKLEKARRKLDEEKSGNQIQVGKQHALSLRKEMQNIQLALQAAMAYVQQVHNPVMVSIIDSLFFSSISCFRTYYYLNNANRIEEEESLEAYFLFEQLKLCSRSVDELWKHEANPSKRRYPSLKNYVTAFEHYFLEKFDHPQNE